MGLPNLPTQAATQLDTIASHFNLYRVASQDVAPTVTNHGGEHDDEDHGDHHRNANLANGHDGHDDEYGDHHRNATLASKDGDHGDGHGHDKGGHHRISMAEGSAIAPILANHDDEDDGDHHGH
jgi:hypothetical protein